MANKKKPKIKNKHTAKAKRPVKKSSKRPKTKAKSNTKEKRTLKKSAARPKTKSKTNFKAKNQTTEKLKPLKSKPTPKKNPLELEKSFLLKLPYQDFDLVTLFLKSREIIRAQGIEDFALHQFQTAVKELKQNELAWYIYDKENLPEDAAEEDLVLFSDDAQACAYTKMAIEEENAFHFFALTPYLSSYTIGSQCPFIDGSTFTVEAGEAETTSCYGVLVIKQGDDLYAFKAGIYDDIGTRISPVKVPTLWEEKAKAYLRSLTTLMVPTKIAEAPNHPLRLTDFDDLISLWQEVSRNPFGNDLGYQADDGNVEIHTLFFKNEKELLEHLVALESNLEEAEEDDFIALRDSLVAVCRKYHWTLTTDLMQKLNSSFSGTHKIKWWGSFAAEFAKGEQGYFAGDLEGILEEYDHTGLTDVTQLSAEAKQAIAESLAES